MPPIPLPPYGEGEWLFNSADVPDFAFGDGERSFSVGSAQLVVGSSVIAYVLDGWTIVAQSAPAVVAGAAQGESEVATRQQIIDACGVTMDSPHAEGAAAGAFSLADTSAHVSVRLHDSIDFARLTVFAYPKAARFDPDNTSHNKSLFSCMVRDGEDVRLDEVTAEFGDKLAALDTSYNLVAYLYFQVPPAANDDYQYATSQTFALVDESGQTTENYTYPKASIVEEALPTGATTMHVSLSGDKRLFQLAEATKDNGVGSRFAIHFMVVEYDASIERFDMGEDSYETLYDEYATKAFTNREIELNRPLTSGRKVRALCYWTQYDGELAQMSVPRGVDYDGRDNEAIVVADDAPPIVAIPAVSVDRALTTETTSFAINAKNLPENAVLFVKSFVKGETIEYGHDKGTTIATFSPYAESAPTNGANPVTLNKGLPVGSRVVAFVLADGEVVAQSEPVTVGEQDASASVSFASDTLAGDAESVVVKIDGEVPEGAALLVKSFGAYDSVAYDKGTPHGWLTGVSAGDNELTLTNADKLPAGGRLVAFLMHGGKPVAQSDPAIIRGTPDAPTATIGLGGSDASLTQGDRFISLRWSVDARTKDASYKLYQYTTDELDESTAQVIASGSLPTSTSNHSGVTSVSLGRLEAGAKLQLVLTADGVRVRSNTMVVAADAPVPEQPAPVSIDKATVTLKQTGATYNGKAQKPAVASVRLDKTGKAVPASGYTVSYLRSGKKTTDLTSAGVITVVVTGKGGYTGSARATFTIAKAESPMRAKAAKKTSVKASATARRAVSAGRPIKVTKAVGKVSYQRVKGSKRISVNAKTGEVKVKKGTPKGTYRITVRVADTGDANRKGGSRNVRVTVRVR